MARISTYALDLVIHPDDKLHGSDENNVTRNFKFGPGGGPGNVVNYITECDSRALGFLYHNNYYDGNATPQPGTIVANNETSTAATFQFDQVTSFLVSKIPYAASLAGASSNTCLNIMNEHVGEKVIWQDVQNPDNYGIYQCNSWVVDATYSNHYNMGLTHLSSNATLQASPTPLVYTIEVWGGGDKTFTHDQTSTATSWTVVHGLAKYPAVQIELEGGGNGYGNITYDSVNQLTINFSASYAGKAHCN